MRVLDVAMTAEESLRRWRDQVKMTPYHIPIPAEETFVVLLCKFATRNADQVGTSHDSLEYPDNFKAVDGLIRLLARQLIWFAREHPKNSHLLSERAERFQQAAGITITRKYDFATAIMAYALSGASIEDVPRPEGFIATKTKPRGIDDLIERWRSHP